jgi:hypothetical protein
LGTGGLVTGKQMQGGRAEIPEDLGGTIRIGEHG